MKRKKDVQQGTLALMVLKTLDLLQPLHGYGIARRIEQISGDLGQSGDNYPVLLRLEQERDIASEWGVRSENTGEHAFTGTRAVQRPASREGRLGADSRNHGALLRRQKRGSWHGRSESVTEKASKLRV